MEVTDIIKLVYQNEFGGGHLISNPENSLRYLKKECDELTFFNDEEYDDIGNGLIRYNLSFLKNDEAKIVNLNEIFVKSANSHKGSLSSFLKKIELVKEMCNDNLLPFSSKELNDYFKKMEKIKKYLQKIQFQTVYGINFILLNFWIDWIVYCLYSNH